MSYHAKLSPSGSERWSTCTASIQEEEGKPNESNAASRWGTACHLLASTCLENGLAPVEYLGMSCVFWQHPESSSSGETIYTQAALDAWSGEADCVHVVPYDEEQVECATSYVNFVKSMRDVLDGEMWIETAVPIDHVTDEIGATGTADTIIIPKHEPRLVVVDLKGGMYRVDAMKTVVEPIEGGQRVVTRPNKQLAMYASGAFRALKERGYNLKRFAHVTLIIVQPRLNHVSEYTISIDELQQCIGALRDAAWATKHDRTYSPSFETCHYCKAKATCPEFKQMAVFDVFGEVTADELAAAEPRPIMLADLATLYRKLDMIELWCSAVRAMAHKEILEGRHVDGLKMVQGRMGNRYWQDPERAAQLLSRDFALLPHETHTKPKLVSPTAIEALTKAKKGETPRLSSFRWELLKGQVRQEPGKPVVVRDDDPRPAIQRMDNDAFSEVNSEAAAPSDTGRIEK